MTLGALALSAPAAALTGLYAAIALLLLSLQLKSAWRWPVKSAAIVLALPATIAAFLTLQAQLGWPIRSSLPASFKLHAAVIDEPATRDADGGAIFLWLTPLDDAQQGADAEDANASDRRPRAFALPYSRDLHQQVQSLQERLARGELVVGRYQTGHGWQRRFNSSDGTVDLEAPPPPLLPDKEG